MVIQLAKSDIYKVHILDSRNATKRILVFCKNESANANDIFSAPELKNIQENDIPVIYSKEQVYLDDTIHSIKKKIIGELGAKEVAYPEIYLFCKIPQYIDIASVREELDDTEDEQVLMQLLRNYNINAESSDVDIDSIFRGKPILKNKAIGTYYGESTSHLFAANPFDILQTNLGIIREEEQIILMDNNLLLNYHFGKIEQNTIYVCLIEDVLNYGLTIAGSSDSYMIRTYYPLLYKDGIRSSGEWTLQKQRFIKENDTYINKNTLLYQQSINVFYDIYYGRNGHDISYLSRGIANIDFKIKSSYNAFIPLESIFKTIHSTKNVPFIKWNPGTRRENVYRLYTETRTNDGKHIPFLPENVVTKLSKELGKSKQIALYIMADNHTFQMTIEQNGDILLSSQFKTPVMVDELTRILTMSVNPIIHSINAYLTQVGYSIPIFQSFYEENIEVINIDYTMETKLTNELNFGKYIGCISSVFDIIEDNDKSGTQLLFKRVENFREMDAQSRLITEMYKKTDDIEDILNVLMQNYKMSEDEAKERVIEYTNTHQDVRGKIVDNQGFMVSMKVSFFDKILKIDVKNILSVVYLDTLFIYLDSMIRLSQYPETVSIPKKDLQGICTKIVKIDKEILNPQVANVLAAAPQPIRFIKPKMIEEEEEEEDDDKGIFYGDDDDEEELGGGSGDADEAEESDSSPKDVTYKLNPVGQSLKNPPLFFKRMQQLEPQLFVSEQTGKFQGYSRLCLSSMKRQPVILTKDELDRIDKSSYTEALKYGSDPEKPYYYICPRYWCLLNNTSMTEEDVIAGKCAKLGKPDKIIPENAKVVPKDAFVYEFNHPIQHYEKGKGEYHMGYPGFLKEKNPQGKLMPCCFKKPRQNWKYMDDQNEEEREKEEANEKPKVKAPRKRTTQTDVTGYIISNETFPMRQINRFGFLPLSVQLFLQFDNNQCVTENNAALIKPNSVCILRSSVEQTTNQSIMGCFADLYANSHELQKTPTIAEFKEILKKNISIDKFISYNNGYLASIFKPSRIDLSKLDISKHENSVFYKSIDLDTQMDFLEDTVASYENFMEYLTDNKSFIDHTYLWDIMVDDNPVLINGGINLVILEIVENDITGNIHLLCPTNSRNKLYDPTKKTFILIKRDVFYEPLCIYKDVDGQIYKSVLFAEQVTLEPIHRAIRIIEKSMNKYCTPNPSLPKIYHFKRNINAQDLYNQLIVLKEKLLYQVLNYQYKTIGIVVNVENKPIYVPCHPSHPIPDMETHIVDEDNVDIWSDYYTTTEELKRLAGLGVLCTPRMKVVEDGLIVGILTETNQFVQIDPPTENVAVNDGLPIIKTSNYNIADKMIASSKQPMDKDRLRVTTFISLESQFYSLFRTIVRDLLNQYDMRKDKQKILKVIDSPTLNDSQKIRKISSMIRNIVGNKVVFNDFEEDVLMEFHDLICTKEMPSPYCVVKNNSKNPTLVIPKRHLLTDKDNEIIYFGRIADELVRYKRIRLFMLNDKNYLNIGNSEYKMNEDEFILIQTSINNDYLKNLIPMNVSSYIQNTNIVNAQPQISQKYSNERIPLREQIPLDMDIEPPTEQTALDEHVISCIQDIVDVIGNPQQSLWKRIFPKTAKEMKFKNTSANCSFYSLIAAFQMEYNVPVSLMALKIALTNAYLPYMEKYSNQILKMLKLQGKHDIVSSIENKEMTLETAIMTPEYYLSDLDIIVFAKQAKMQICLFNSNGLPSLYKKNIQWYICGQTYNQRHYFIRSATLAGKNKVGQYHLIDRGYYLNELGIFEKIVQDSIIGISNEVSSPESIQPLEHIL